ncbi:MAG: pyridoxal-phosphate dependent enzyme [Candidatus Abawacabacteria bacterium]|nr:pyridoxal-phosphate dependent enzyme [Candidatus Abawacabacteria bacterium]
MDHLRNIETPGEHKPFLERLADRELTLGLTDAEVIVLSGNRAELYRRLQAGIGRTPVRIISLANENTLIQKDETAGPAESHYDRCYLRLLQALEQDGTISPGDTLLEVSSGSAGISFAWMCKKLGYRPVLFMPDFIPKPRIEFAQALAEVHLSSDRDRYVAACVDDMMAYRAAHKALIKATGQKLWLPNHSQDKRSPLAFAEVATEAASQHAQPIDYFIGGIGNGTTLMGIGGRLKELYPDCRVIGFEPARACPTLRANPQLKGALAPSLTIDELPAGYGMHDLPGTGGFGNLSFPFIQESVGQRVLDEISAVDERTILAACSERYNSELPIELRQGHTSIVARWIAEQVAEKVEGKTFVTVVYDRADRY